MDTNAITQKEFAGLADLLFRVSGIRLGPGKHAMVCSRIGGRLRERGAESYTEYLHLLTEDRAELQRAVDLLTTNETYFFREPAHFDFLRERLLPAHPRDRAFRLWSAACSTGEEVYSLAMVLADCLGEGPWEVLGSDISTRVLEIAATANYPLERAQHIPERYLRRFCLRGVRSQEGRLLVDRKLRERVRLRQINLIGDLPDLGLFDAIFLRNAMIYFEPETRTQVIRRLTQRIRLEGHFVVGHSEAFHGVSDELVTVGTSVYRRRPAP